MAKTLEEIRNDVLDYCKGKLSVFHAYAIEGNPIKWNTALYGDDYRGFIDVALQNGVKIVYMVVEKPNKANVERLGHKDELIIFELYYYIGSTMHRYTKWADWYTSPPPSPNKKTEETYYR